MEKIKKFFSNKKNVTICASALAIILVIVLIIVFVAKGNNQQKKLEKYMKELGKVYWEEIYYPSFKDDATRSEHMAKYTTLGIKTDLNNLVRAVAGRNDLGNSEEILAKFVNNETGKECNRSSSKVYFYPYEPYGASDYKLEVELVCGFEEK